MFRASSAHLQEDTVLYKQHNNVTLCKSSWWPVDTQLAAYRQATRTLIDSDGTICCLYTTMYSWRWALDARNM